MTRELGDHEAVVVVEDASIARLAFTLPDGRYVRSVPTAVKERFAEQVKEFYVVPSYASGSWLPLHFGLGNAVSARVSVRWPDGTAQDLGDVPKGAWKLKKGGALEPLRARR